jgi:hypothetical protein
MLFPFHFPFYTLAQSKIRLEHGFLVARPSEKKVYLFEHQFFFFCLPHAGLEIYVFTSVMQHVILVPSLINVWGAFSFWHNLMWDIQR